MDTGNSPTKRKRRIFGILLLPSNLRKNNGLAEVGSDSDDPVYTLICKNTSLGIWDEVKVKSLP